MEGNSAGGNAPPRRVQFLTSCVNNMSSRVKSPEPAEEEATPASRTNEVAPVSNLRIAGSKLRTVKLVMKAHVGHIIMFFTFLNIFILTYMAYWWGSLYFEVTSAMAQTFAWEMIIKLVGSSYENCENSLPEDEDEPLFMSESRAQCLDFNYTIPWLPLAGVMFSLFMVVVVIIAVIRLVRSKKTAYSVLALLSILCTLNCVFVAYAIHHMDNTTGFSNSPYNGLDYIMLREQMANTVEYSKGQSLDEIHFRWVTSQNTFSCCGIDGFSTWDSNSFNIWGDPRYPKSCCNKADDFDCETSFPQRFKVNPNGCLQFELAAVRTFRNSMFHLLIGNLCVMFVSVGFVAFLGIFLKMNDFSLIPLEVQRIRVRWCGKEFSLYAASSFQSTSTSPSPVPVSRWRETTV